MKRITLGALDYAVAFGVVRTLRSLLLEGRLSAVGCLVASELWSREFKPMQDVAQKVGNRALIGVTLAFSGDRVHPHDDQKERGHESSAAHSGEPDQESNEQSGRNS